MVIFPVVENVNAHVNNSYEDTHRSIYLVNIIKRATIGPLVKNQSNGRLWPDTVCWLGTVNLEINARVFIFAKLRTCEVS